MIAVPYKPNRRATDPIDKEALARLLKNATIEIRWHSEGFSVRLQANITGAFKGDLAGNYGFRPTAGDGIIAFADSRWDGAVRFCEDALAALKGRKHVQNIRDLLEMTLARWQEGKA